MRRGTGTPGLALAAVLLAGGATSCVQFSWERHVTFEPVRTEAVDGLRIGESSLGDALGRLGAPLYVWEGAHDAVVLGYGSENRREVGFDVSVPVFDSANASFSFDDVAKRLEGYVLVFDDKAVLRIVRRGLLRDLALTERTRPAYEE